MFKKIIILIFVSIILQSCASKKDVWYYQDSKDKIETQEKINYFPTNIQINDILYIKVSALNAEAAEPFNVPSSPTSSSSSSSSSSASASGGGSDMKLQGYLVSSEGTIFFPILGTIKIYGKTINEAQDVIKNLLSDGKYVKNPIVTVRIINNKFTILGEVKTPGTYSFDEQNLTINKALGMAGDLTINGKRKDVLLIREVDGIRTYVNIDLTSTNFFDSPYYYIKQNDVLIVNQNGPQVSTSGYIKDFGTALGILTFLTTVFLLVKTL